MFSRIKTIIYFVDVKKCKIKYVKCMVILQTHNNGKSCMEASATAGAPYLDNYVQFLPCKIYSLITFLVYIIRPLVI